MKQVFSKYPDLSRLLLGALLIGCALIASGLINFPGLQTYFPFVGTILLLLVTWIMYRTENKNLSALGLDFRKRHLIFLPIGLGLGVLTYVLGFYLRTFITREQWHVNPVLNVESMLHQLYWVLPTVIVQQLISRGYCFKKLMEMTNQSLAIIVCGVLFIALHDFWKGSVMQGVVFATLLFLGHLMFCLALIRSGTLYFAIGLHWGNNVANQAFFTERRRASSIIYSTSEQPHNLSSSQFLAVFILANAGFILLTFLLWRWRGLGMLVTPKTDATASGLET